jgi:serine acetyltransferase
VVNRPVPPGSLARGVPARVDDEWATRHAADDAEDTDELGDRTED